MCVRERGTHTHTHTHREREREREREGGGGSSGRWKASGRTHRNNDRWGDDERVHF
jgi:hypothetical protein